jgi:hypothetical protein
MMPEGVTAIAATDATPRKGHELREAIRTALKRWAKPTNEEAQEAAREFISLFIEIERDDKLAASQREYLRTKVRRRLLDLRVQIARWVAIQKRLAKQKARESKGQSDKSDSLAGGNDVGSAPDAASARGGAAMGTADYGQLLIDLIQRTIHPESWDVNGGPGSIFYWYPGRALVIRQTGEIHEKTGDMLDQMRRL